MTPRRWWMLLAVAVLAVAGAAYARRASRPPAPALPAGSFAFAVFGDGPYDRAEEQRWARLLADVRGAEVEWLVHVGDLLGQHECSDAVYAARRAELDALPYPVVYTPGDNEWADCYRRRTGGHDPLERLDAVRRIFMPEPARSLGARPMALASQASDTAFAEFVENRRWVRGGFVFATVHVVGSRDAMEKYPARTARHDSAAARRRLAALAWLDSTFAHARSVRARGVVLAAHANTRIDNVVGDRVIYEAFDGRLAHHAAAFGGPVLLIHGDSHEYRVDRPLRDSTGRRLDNFTRLETFGSPDIGWVRVVVDTVAGRVTAYEPHLVSPW